MVEPHLALIDVERVYRKQNESFRLFVENLTIEEGDKLVVLGENGSGKSTLARIAGFIEKPDKGELYFRGKEVTSAKEADIIRKKVVTLFQKPVSFRGTVKENLELAARLRGLSTFELSELIKNLNLNSLLNKNASNISSGELRRVQLAQALAGKPEIVIFDEPTSFLDEKSRIDFLSLLQSYSERAESTFIFITHRLDEALFLGKKFVFLNQGKIINIGEAEKFFYSSNNHFEKLYGCLSVVSGKVANVQERLVSLKTETHEIYGYAETELKPGENAYALIRCDSVILSKELEESSSVNNFEAVVEKIESENGFCKVYFNKPFLFKAVITQSSKEKLNLFPGSKCFASVKASSVKIVKTV